MNLEQSVLDRIQRIKLIALDVDGVMTDGGIYLGDSGEMKKFNVQDGAGIAMAIKAGYKVAIITGRESKAVTLRAQELKIEEVYQGVSNKVKVMEELCEKYGFQPAEIMYMGDDIPDIQAFEYCGLGIVPFSGTADAKAHAHYITHQTAGHGAIREAIELVMRNQGSWEQTLKEYLDKKIQQ